MVGGAAPQVFAHSAMTRNFEITDEIELNDDLDNKPDDERSPLDLSIQVYYGDIEYFLDSLLKLRQSGRFDLKTDRFEVAQSTALPCVPANKVGSYTPEIFVASNELLRPQLEAISKRLADGYSLADCVPSPHFAGQEASHSRFVLKLDNKELAFEIGVQKSSKLESDRFLSQLETAWDKFTHREITPTRKLISKGTTLKAVRDRILVVTRLPRAALDALLATNAK